MSRERSRVLKGEQERGVVTEASGMEVPGGALDVHPASCQLHHPSREGGVDPVNAVKEQVPRGKVCGLRLSKFQSMPQDFSPLPFLRGPVLVILPSWIRGRLSKMPGRVPWSTHVKLTGNENNLVQ